MHGIKYQFGEQGSLKEMYDYSAFIEYERIVNECNPEEDVK